ncbi:FAD/NAD(P)-binding domain-containing protein [Basidiobolus meristosporus CBS 931.73]|uniref:FAD/NAD(P)-binding domain-containing protein n=1 Tax=Basidiobolus meristosporus CBS 931.73 TaxID=1314790 RepID=A0A1Y1WY17_9FUNG|nr:FAD/NAD(P)-binding domain-containing protein [Basidiobolus meristosporus CBS 931.73]|eukprot:ORX78469.1 FAD/NAD(P)-binding domain-containing protein [Basidiobolus meristosporus CBS 931.73]
MVFTETRIVVVGGAFAGLEVVQTLAKASKKLQLQVTLVEPHEHFHHNLGFVRAVTQKGFAQKCFIPLKNAPIFTSGTVVHERARVVKTFVDRVSLDDGREIAFDYLVLATGSQYGTPGKPSGDMYQDVLKKLTTALEAVEKARRILVVGGGSVGIELVGELTDLPNKEVTLVANGILTGMPDVSDKLRRKLVEKMTKRGVKLVDNQRVNLTAEEREVGYVAETRGWDLSSGEKIEADLMFACIGHTSLNTSFASTLGDGVLNPITQEIRVRPTMQLQTHDHIFAVGDCNDEGHKLAFAARLQGSVAAKNIIKLIQAKYTPTSPAIVKLNEFKIIKAAMITLGAHDGAAQMPGIGVIGRTLVTMLKGKDFLLKDTYKQFNATAPGV